MNRGLGGGLTLSGLGGFGAFAAFAREHFTWDNAARAMESVYGSVLRAAS